MATVLYVLLALASLSSGLAVVLARRPTHAGVALGLNALSLAAIAATLSAQLVALAWAVTGVGIMLVSLVTLGGGGWGMGQRSETLSQGPEREGVGLRGRGAATLVLGLLSCLALGTALLVGYIPGQTLLGLEHPGEIGEGTVALVAILYGRYGTGVVGVALVLLVAGIGGRLHGERK